MKTKGISLIALVVIIVITIILASTIIISILQNSPIDLSKKAKFMSDFRTMQKAIDLYSLSKYNMETNEFELPLKGYLTNDDKIELIEKVPTLKTKIEELSGLMEDTKLAWINNEDVNVKLSKQKAEKGYIMDVEKGLLYDYNGDFFENKRWHTLDGGVTTGGKLTEENEDLIWGRLDYTYFILSTKCN